MHMHGLKPQQCTAAAPVTFDLTATSAASLQDTEHICGGVQANVTDNTPIYILGGNILPFGQGGMTTTQARTSPLKLVVALANTTGSATADRCSGKCPVQEVRSSHIQALSLSQISRQCL